MSSQHEKIRVLIVDDEDDVAELSAEVLSRAGYDVDVANRAVDALHLMRNTVYDLIISDLNMPEVNGRGFFEHMKSEFPHLLDRIGFVTGDTMGRASQDFLREADRPFLEKPASPKELRALVDDILRRTGAAG